MAKNICYPGERGGVALEQISFLVGLNDLKKLALTNFVLFPFAVAHVNT